MAQPKLNPHERVFNAILLIGVLAIFLALLYYIPSQMELSEDELYSCSADSDCILVKGDCCGCSMGGNNTAINKAYEDYWAEKMNEDCEGLICPAVISTHWTCSASAKCNNGRCELWGVV